MVSGASRRWRGIVLAAIGMGVVCLGLTGASVARVSRRHVAERIRVVPPLPVRAPERAARAIAEAARKAAAQEATRKAAAEAARKPALPVIAGAGESAGKAAAEAPGKAAADAAAKPSTEVSGKVVAEAPANPADIPAPARPRTPAEAAYFVKLANYKRVRAAFEKQASAYWTLITDKRQTRRKRRADGLPITLEHYVLDQPPAYAGPSAPPVPPSLVKPRPPADDTPPPRPTIPVVADFVEQAKTHFNFVPESPATEADFKRAYAQAAVRAGITKDQAVRIYGFEASGNGRHDVQAGFAGASNTANRRAISTAIGYNQLLVTNTISLLADHDGKLIAALTQKAAEASGERRARLEAKIAVLQQMIRHAQSVPKKWSDQEALAKTPKGWAVHALNLDVDVGPLLQVLKLTDSIAFARMKGITGRLTAAELEMMNLMGDGSGFDVLSMPEAMRAKVPTSNMFQRGGYERNPVARRNNTVAALLSATDARMDSQTDLPGAREMEAAFDAAVSASAAPVR